MTRFSRVLAVDVGAGTQDILLYEDGATVENCVQLVLPSPTVVLARRIARATAQRLPIHLAGEVMGGGAITGAVRAHLRAGLAVSAAPAAALTLHDNPARVEGMGIRLTDAAPPDTVLLELADLDLPALRAALAGFEVSVPDTVAVAVQDHGYSPDASNRVFRFQHWRRFVEAGGDIRDLIYEEPPAYFTRMLAVRRTVPGAYTMDTGAAAIWGALCDEDVARRREEGLIVVNAGNAHTVAVLLRETAVIGLFEHHTSSLTPAKLAAHVDALRDGRLTNGEVFAEGGHGCYISPEYRRGTGFAFVAVTGPNRRLATGLGYYAAVPYGDMMLSGCFGLVAALQAMSARAR